MKKIFYPLFIAALLFLAGCEDTFYDVYNDFTGPADSVLIKKTTSVVIYSSEQLYEIVYPSMTKNKAVTWSSDFPGIASVDSSGKITGNALGNATITVTTVDGSKTADCIVTVVPTPVAVTGVSINKTSLNLGIGGSDTLIASFTQIPAPTNQAVTWESDNTAVADVNSAGLVHALATGTAVITLTTKDGGFKETCTVTVVPPVAVTGVTLDADKSIKIGDLNQLTAVVSPSNATNKTVLWSSSKTSVATVDSNGLVTGISAGSAVIIVTTQDGVKTAVCTVTVLSNARTITAFTFPASTSTVINQASKTISVTVPGGTNLSALIASFTASANSTVKISGVTQASGTTANSFASDKVYTVTAEDGTDAAYTVTVSGWWTSLTSLSQKTTGGSHNFYSLALDFDGSTIIAGDVNGYIYSSVDYGSTWRTPYNTAGGSYIKVAASYDGARLTAAYEQSNYIYTSSDGGVNWSTHSLPKYNLNWVTTNFDGTMLATFSQGNSIYTSIDSGASWTSRAVSVNWSGLSSSTDGLKLAGSVWDGRVYTSGDGGASWSPAITTGENMISSICSSADGVKLAALRPSMTYIIVSGNSGANWAQKAAPITPTSVAISPDGNVIAIAGSSTQIYLSIGGGAFTAQTSTGSRDWRALAWSGNGNCLAGAVYGGNVFLVKP